MSRKQPQQRWCRCGATWSAPADATLFWRMWEREHSGPGHAPCDARVAARARVRAMPESAETVEAR